MTLDTHLPSGCYVLSQVLKDGQASKEVCEYFARRLGYPDARGQFASSLGPLKYAFRVPVIGPAVVRKAFPVLEKTRRDAIILQCVGSIRGNVAYHYHDGSNPKRAEGIHIFDIYVDEHCRGMGFGAQMVEKVITTARENGVASVRVTGGNSPEAIRVYERLCQRSETLGVCPRDGYWLDVKQ